MKRVASHFALLVSLLSLGTGCSGGGKPSVPGAPTAVRASAGIGSATVSWQPPTKDGNSSILRYVITGSPGELSTTVGREARSTSFDGLSRGTTYTFSVAAENELGQGNAASADPIETPDVPSVPLEVAAQAGVRSVTVSWAAATDRGSSILRYVVTVIPGDRKIAVDKTARTALVDGLNDGATYRFTVGAVNEVGDGPLATTNPVTTHRLPAAPDQVVAAAGVRSAIIRWRPSDDGGSSILRYRIVASTGTAVAEAAGTTTSAEITGLENGTMYRFTITASNAVGDSPSATSNAVTTPTFAGPPTQVSATAGIRSAIVRWTAPANDGGSPIQSYRIVANPGGTEATAAASATSGEVTGLANGRAYTFSVAAVTAVGLGQAASSSSVTTPDVPSVPTGLVATADIRAASVRWTAPASDGGRPISGYRITAEPGGTTATVEASATEGQVTGLNNGTAYRLTVVALNAVGSGPGGVSNQVTTPDVPRYPTDVRATAGVRSATVNWTPVGSDGGRPILQYRITTYPGGALTTVPNTSSSVVINDLSDNRSYYFTVAAVNAVGIGPTGVSNNILTPNVPAAPSGVRARADTRSALIQWTRPTSDGRSPILGYAVTANPGGSVTNVTGDITSTTVSELSADTTYTFTVSAFNAVGTGPSSAASNAIRPLSGPEDEVWRLLSPTAPPPSVAAIAYDSRRQRTVVFGVRREPETWEWDGHHWEKMNPAHQPSRRYESAMAFDEARGVSVLFGGRYSDSFSDTWTWDGTDWTLVTPEASPDRRSGHAMAYDSARQCIVLFGGLAAGSASETWEWDGSNWNRRTPSVSPSRRFWHALGYDGARHRTVLYGGNNFGALGETWEWDGDNWARATPRANPPALYYHAMAFDAALGRVVLYGGTSSRDGDTTLSDVWHYDGETWTRVSGTPGPRQRHGMVHDAARGSMVVFGGSHTVPGYSYPRGDTWERTSGEWTRVDSGVVTASSRAMTYDERRDRVVIFGDSSSNPRRFTWEYDGSQWNSVPLSSGPLRDDGFSMVYDSRRGVSVMFGGRESGGYSPWEWNGQGWQRRYIGSGPSGSLTNVGMAYDSRRGMTVVFGGDDCSRVSCPATNETWEWDGLVWRRRNPSVSPAARGVHAMAYDSARGRTVMFGGSTATGWSNNTWEWDGIDWIEKHPSVSPPARIRHAMAFDPLRGRVIMVGGYTGTEWSNNAWEWDGNSWMPRPLQVRPSLYWDVGLAFDVARSRLLLQNYDQTWVYQPGQ